MATAVGYGALPISVSLRGMREQLINSLEKPMLESSKRAAEGMEKSIKTGAERAADAVERARKREAKAAEEVIAAEKKVTAEKAKTEQSIKSIEVAEKRLEAVRDQGRARVAQAEANYEKVLNNSKSTAEQVAAAEEKVAAARSKAESNSAAAELEVSKAREKTRLATESAAHAEDVLSAKKRIAADASDNVIAATRRMDNANNDVEASTRRWGQSLREASGQMSGFDSVLGTTMRNAARFGAVVAAGLGIAGGAAFFGDAIRQGRDLSAVMGELQAVSGSTAEQMSIVSARAKELGNDNTLAGTSAASATDAMLALAKGGFTVQQAMDAAKGSIQLAGAAQIDAGTAAELQIAAINSFGLAASDASRVADVMTNAANSSATSLVELGDSMKFVAPTASTLGVSLEDTSAMIGLFANNGIKGSEAGTAMRSAMLSLVSPSKEGAKALAEMGINALDANGQFVGLRSISEQLAAAQDRMGESAFTAAAATAFGREAVGFATTAAQGGAAAFDEMRAALDRQGSAGETAGAKLSGLNGAIERVQNGLDDFKLRLYELAEPTLTSWADKLSGAISWASDNIPAAVTALGQLREEFGFLTFVLGGVAGAYGAIKLASAGLWAVEAAQTFIFFVGQIPTLLAAWRAGTLAQTAAQLGLNAAMFANPIGAVVLAIGALVGALTWWFTQTESGKTAWQSFTSLVKTAWDWAAQGVQHAWHTWIQPTWEAVKAGATWLWDNVLNPVFSAIWNHWQNMANGLKIAWDYVIKPVFDLFGSVVSFLVQAILGPQFQAIRLAWEVVSTILSHHWNTVIKPMFDAFGSLVTWLWQNVFSPTFSWIGDKLQWVGDKVHSVYHNGIKPALEAFRDNMTRAKDHVDWASKAMGDAFDRARQNIAKPIKFVVERVYNDGIRKAWNSVGKIVGLDELPEHKVAFARGGVLPGYSPGVDNYRFFSPKFGFLELGGGEAIMRPEWTRAVGGERAVKAMNDKARTGGVRGVQRMLGQGAAFADGGVFDETIGRVMAQLQPEHGKPYQYGGTGNPSWDCSGLWSGITQALNGGNLRGGRIFNTESVFENFGFEKGLSGRVTIGVMRGGGGPNSHMAGTIDGVNIESAGDHGVQIGGRARGSDHSMFGLHWTLTKFLGNFVSGGNGGGGGVAMRSIVAGIMEPILNSVGNAIPNDMPGIIGKLPRAMYDKLKDKVLEFVKGKADSMGGASGGPVGAGVERWRPLVEKILVEKGFDRNKSSMVLRRMDQESSGDPNSINNWDSNAAKGTPSKGLMQVIDPTFQSNKDPGYDNIWDPEANIRASMNYAIRQYGSLEAAYNRSGGYARGGVLPKFQGVRLYDQGGFIPHRGGALNLSGRPEPVLTAAQWDSVSGLVAQMGNLVPVLDNLVRGLGVSGGIAPVLENLDAQIGHWRTVGANVNNAILDLGTLLTERDLDVWSETGLQFGAGIVDNTKEVIEAEKALASARKSTVSNLDNIGDLEKKIADAREELAKVEKDGGGLSTAQKRKLADAEDALNKARESGKPDQIARAETRLARVREDNANALEKSSDKNAKKVKEATQKVEAAEDKLTEAREKAADNAAKLADAEKKVIQARLEAMAKIVTNTFEGLTKAAEAMEKHFKVLTEIQETVNKARLEAQKLRLEFASDSLALWKANYELRKSEWELTRTKLQGAIDVERAEAKLAEARDAQNKIGATGVDALGRAFDRFRQTGVFAFETLTNGVVERTSEIAAAEWAVAEARAQAALDQQAAALNQQTAALAAQEATLQHAYTAQMLQLSTARLEAQARSFYGLTTSQATGAQRGIGGIGGLLGGILKVVGGIAGAGVSLATGNIPGAVLAGATALGGLTESFSGISAIWNNKDNIRKAWDAMDWKGKAALILGVGGSAAITGAGAAGALSGHGPELAAATSELSKEWMNLTWGGFVDRKNQSAQKIELDYAHRAELLKQELEARKAALEIEKTRLSLQSLQATDKLKLAVDLSKLEQELAKASSKEEAKAIGETIKQIKEQLAKGLPGTPDLNRIQEQINKAAADITRAGSAAGNTSLKVVNVNIPAGAAVTTDQLRSVFDEISKVESGLEIRLNELTSTTPTAADFAYNRR